MKKLLTGLLLIGSFCAFSSEYVAPVFICSFEASAEDIDLKKSENFLDLTSYLKSTRIKSNAHYIKLEVRDDIAGPVVKQEFVDKAQMFNGKVGVDIIDSRWYAGLKMRMHHVEYKVDLKFILDSYNEKFSTNYSLEDLDGNERYHLIKDRNLEAFYFFTDPSRATAREVIYLDNYSKVIRYRVGCENDLFNEIPNTDKSLAAYKEEVRRNSLVRSLATKYWQEGCSKEFGEDYRKLSEKLGGLSKQEDSIVMALISRSFNTERRIKNFQSGKCKRRRGVM